MMARLARAAIRTAIVVAAERFVTRQIGWPWFGLTLA